MSGAVVAVTMLATGSRAHAADLSIPIDTAYGSGVAAGQEVELAAVAAADLAGRECVVSAARRDSATDVNAGNDIVVRSGAGSVTLADVERQAGVETAGDTLVLGERISVVLVMGPAEEFAGDLDVRFDCAPAPVAAAADEPGPGAALAEPGGDLPATGSETSALALLAVGLIALGTGAVLTARLPAGVVSGPRGQRRTTDRTAGWVRRGHR